jgi:hypothetical protein
VGRLTFPVAREAPTTYSLLMAEHPLQKVRQGKILAVVCGRVPGRNRPEALDSVSDEPACSCSNLLTIQINPRPPSNRAANVDAHNGQQGRKKMLDKE